MTENRTQWWADWTFSFPFFPRLYKCFNLGKLINLSMSWFSYLPKRKMVVLLKLKWGNFSGTLITMHCTVQLINVSVELLLSPSFFWWWRNDGHSSRKLRWLCGSNWWTWQAANKDPVPPAACPRALGSCTGWDAWTTTAPHTAFETMASGVGVWSSCVFF